MNWPEVALAAVVAASGIAVVWLRQRAAKAMRDEQRDERDTSAIAGLTKRCEVAEATVAKMLTEWKAFSINHTRAR